MRGRRTYDRNRALRRLDLLPRRRRLHQRQRPPRRRDDRNRIDREMPPAEAEEEDRRGREEAGTVDKLEEEENRQAVEERATDLQVEARLAAARWSSPPTRIDVASGRAERPSANFIAVGQRSADRFGRSLVGLLAAQRADLRGPRPPESDRRSDRQPSLPLSPARQPSTAKRRSRATWTGDLSVDLPGFGTVPLTGAGVKASICQATACPSGGLFSAPIAGGGSALR